MSAPDAISWLVAEFFILSYEDSKRKWLTLGVS